MVLTITSFLICSLNLEHRALDFPCKSTSLDVYRCTCHCTCLVAPEWQDHPAAALHQNDPQALRGLQAMVEGALLTVMLQLLRCLHEYRNVHPRWTDPLARIALQSNRIYSASHIPQSVLVRPITRQQHQGIYSITPSSFAGLLEVRMNSPIVLTCPVSVNSGEQILLSSRMIRHITKTAFSLNSGIREGYEQGKENTAIAVARDTRLGV